MSKKPGKSHGFVTLLINLESWYFSIQADIFHRAGVSFKLIFRLRTVAGETRVVAKMWDWVNILKLPILWISWNVPKNLHECDLPESKIIWTAGCIYFVSFTVQTKESHVFCTLFQMWHYMPLERHLNEWKVKGVKMTFLLKQINLLLGKVLISLGGQEIQNFCDLEKKLHCKLTDLRPTPPLLSFFQVTCELFSRGILVQIWWVWLSARNNFLYLWHFLQHRCWFSRPEEHSAWPEAKQNTEYPCPHYLYCYQN